MRAARLHGYGEQLRVEEVETPKPGPGEVLVRVLSAGVCHSDLALRDGIRPMLPGFPFILGHETAGVVEALGQGVTEVDAGEPVLVWGGWGCGLCRVCRTGDEQLCDVTRWLGFGQPGSYSEYLLVPAVRHLVPIPDLDPLTAAPIADAGVTPYRAVKRALPRLVGGATVVTFGVGGLGQYGLQYLTALSPARIVAVDLSEEKRALAQDLGADAAVDPQHDDLPSVVEEVSHGAGAAVVLDFVGADATMSMGLSLLAPQGLFTLVGLAGGSVPFSFFGVAAEATVMNNRLASRSDLFEAVELISRGVVTQDVARYPLEEVNEVMAALSAGRVRGRAVLNP